MVMIAAAGGGGSAYGTFGEADKPAARTPCCWRGEAKPETDWVRCQRRGVLRRVVVASCGLALFVCAVFAVAPGSQLVRQVAPGDAGPLSAGVRAAAAAVIPSSDGAAANASEAGAGAAFDATRNATGAGRPAVEVAAAASPYGAEQPTGRIGGRAHHKHASDADAESHDDDDAGKDIGYIAATLAASLLVFVAAFWFIVLSAPTGRSWCSRGAKPPPEDVPVAEARAPRPVAAEWEFSNVEAAVVASEPLTSKVPLPEAH